MVKLSDGKYVQVGIISHGFGCGTKDAPGIHTRVSQYVGWIGSITSGDNC